MAPLFDILLIGNRMQIDYLANQKQYLPQIVDWFYDEWAYLNPGRTSLQLKEKLLLRMNVSLSPCIVIATNTKNLIGTVTICHDELPERAELFPWLSSLYVNPAFRGRGFGESLVSACIDKAKAFGYESMYMYTDKPRLAEWYSRQGWEHYEAAFHNGVDIDIFKSLMKAYQNEYF